LLFLKVALCLNFLLFKCHLFGYRI
jgi:hypothetical protein